MNWKNGMLFVVGAVLISATLILTSRDSAQGQGGKCKGGGQRHIEWIAGDAVLGVLRDQ